MSDALKERLAQAMPEVAAPNAAPVAEVEAALPKWCRGVAFDSRRNVVALRVFVPVPPQLARLLGGDKMPVEFVGSPEAMHALAASLGRCVDAAERVVIEIAIHADVDMDI